MTTPTEPTGVQADAEQRCPDCNRVLNRCWCADLGKYGAVPRLDRGAPTAEPTGAQADEPGVDFWRRRVIEVQRDLEAAKEEVKEADEARMHANAKCQRQAAQIKNLEKKLQGLNK